MRRRLLSWTRLLNVQGQRTRLAEGRLAELLRQQRELEQQQRELLDSFSADDRFAGLFVDLRARRFEAMSKALKLMQPAIVAAEASVLEHAKRRRGIELKLEAVMRDYRADVERQELNEIIEAATARATASLP